MRTPRVRIALGAVAALAIAGAIGGCAPKQDVSPGQPTPSGSPCAKQRLTTVTPGKLTIATDEPVYPPWFVDNKPDNGQGFESAVAYAVAEKLGFDRAEVMWIRVPFNSAIQPGPKPFDFDINGISITEERKAAVDFSSPYYDVTQAVIALKSSKLASVTSLSALKSAKLGARAGTTSYRAITEVVKPDVEPAAYTNNDEAKAALENASIDGLVVDLPTAFYITSAEIEDSVIVGQIPQPSGEPERFGLVLDKDSPLTGCVSQAVDALRADGTLARLERRWLAQAAGAFLLS